MVLLILIIIGAASAYIAIWSAVTFNDSVEERVRSLIYSVLTDFVLLGIFTINDLGKVFTLMLIFKYICFCIVDFNKTLRQ